MSPFPSLSFNFSASEIQGHGAGGMGYVCHVAVSVMILILFVRVFAHPMVSVLSTRVLTQHLSASACEK